MSNERKFAIYSRKSKYTGKGESIENQIELCKEYINLHFGKDALKRVMIYEDEGFSGGNLNRPDFKRMMADAEEGKIQSIIVYRLDRISRNISDFSGLINRLSMLNIGFISIKEQFDTTTPMGRAMMYISSVFSQLERETIAERIKDNMFELAKSGVWLGGITPTGYKSVKTNKTLSNGNIKSFYTLEIVPHEAQVVKVIFDMYLKFHSLTKTENELIKMNIKNRNGNFFTRFSIKAILKNPVYAVADLDSYNYFKINKSNISSSVDLFNGTSGIMPYNRTHQEKGESPALLPLSKWIISVGYHKGIISGNDWVKAQEFLSENKNTGFRNYSKNKAILTGVLFCHCSSRMYPKLSKDMYENGNRKFSYICKSKNESQKYLCDVKNVNGNLLDKKVIDNINLIYENKEILISELEKSFDSIFTDEFEICTYCQKEIDKNNQRINRLLTYLSDAQNGYVKNNVENKIIDLNTQNLKLGKVISENHTLMDSKTNDINIIVNDLLSFKKVFNCSSIDNKRIAVKLIVKEIIWDGISATLKYNV